MRQVEAKYPALLFKQQLTAFLEKIYGMIRDNLKKEISPLLGLCIQVSDMPLSYIDDQKLILCCWITAISHLIQLSIVHMRFFPLIWEPNAMHPVFLGHTLQCRHLGRRGLV